MTDDNRNEGHEHAKGRAPVRAKDSLRPPLAKRFYKDVSVASADEGGFAVLLDGRGIRTPAKRKLVVSERSLADALAAEWAAQKEVIDPATMPMTRIVNTALDAVAERMGDVADDIAAFAGSDLLCYRAEAPEALARRQAAAWDPPLSWAEKALGAKLGVETGIVHREQPPAAIASVRSALDHFDAIGLAALHVMTTLTGSAVLALAHAEGALTSEDAWSAATVDERWQSEQWGLDSEAEVRAGLRRAEFMAASRCLACLHPR